MIVLQPSPFSNFIALFILIFSLLVTVYSWGFMKGRKGLIRYYLYMFLTLLVSLGAVFSADLVMFMVFWGSLGLLLYLLVGFDGTPRAAQTAKKALVIIGGTDALMLLGIAFLWQMTGSLEFHEMRIPLTEKEAILAYLCLAAGAFAKAGAVPFHTWIPDTAADAPTPVTALLPASLDKLLGIYFLSRISLGLFEMTPAMNQFLMLVGSVTIMAGVMMALVQHDWKRLLGYHAVSQVGYMVMGLGTGNPVGIAGGIFHMLNNAIYKTCLFLAGGAVEKRTGTTDLEKLGALGKVMPVIFACFFAASLAISGVPPLNGFVSKWMIYQGILESARGGGYAWVLWLSAAMFGSALTLASFMKVMHAIFMGQPSPDRPPLAETRKIEAVWMAVPSVILAALCVLFGIFALPVPLGIFVIPSLGMDVRIPGVWDASLATVLILAAAGLGFLIYLMGVIAKTRVTEPFVGGEFAEKNPAFRASGTGFYYTIQDLGLLKGIYFLAEKKFFDLYEVGTKTALGVYGVLRYLHNGVLPTYLSWCLLGMLAIFYLLLMR